MSKPGPYGRARKPSRKRLDKGCYNKIRYRTSERAERAAMRLGMRTYPCVRCGGWHLTRRSV